MHNSWTVILLNETVILDRTTPVFNYFSQLHLIESIHQWIQYFPVDFSETVDNSEKQWRIQGGGRPRCAPPPLQTKISLISQGFQENIIKILGRHPPQGLAPPPRRSSGSAPESLQNCLKMKRNCPIGAQVYSPPNQPI